MCCGHNKPYSREHKCLTMQLYSMILEPIDEQWEDGDEINHYDEREYNTPKVTSHANNRGAELDSVRIMSFIGKEKKGLCTY